MNLLIDISDFTGTRDISKNVQIERLNVFIDEAQRYHLKDLLGEKLYQRVVTSPTNADIVKLLDPQDYTCNGVDYHSEGIKRILVNLTFSRYVLGHTEVDTPFGFVRKDSDYSTPTPYNILAVKSKEAKNMAMADFNTIIKYLDCNSVTYPEWKSECSTNIDLFKITKI